MLNGQNGANSKKRKSKVKNNDGSLNQGQDDNQPEDDIDDTRQIFMDKHVSTVSPGVISLPQVDKSTEAFSWGKLDLFVLHNLPSLTILDNLLMKFCTMKDAFDHIAKKQRLSSSKSQEVIDQITWEINEALVKIQSLAIDKEAILSNLNNKLNMMSFSTRLKGYKGLLDLGDCFISETSNTKLTITLSAPFFEMYQVLEAMKCKNLEPTLNWGTAIK
ncbi:hypothetical protein GIB67_022242 [Kingdonia uniflora]|uniref:Uncharacterized protein n=1 Tax=Kingdonia uniflora TaxID=39325 RepID=A0A7J7M743_9MAGN|nr:hypothetical protein GIB67_022242 [Kingdonia uniflora]